jgi:hypothetical protein
MNELSRESGSKDIIKNKKIVFFVFIILILCLVQSFLQMIMSESLENPVVSNLRLALYFIITLLCSLLAFTIGRKKIDKTDKLLLTYAYVFLLSGTIVFIISEFVKDKNLATFLFSTGNVYFYFMHVFFIIRHSRKESVSETEIDKSNKLFRNIIIFLIIFTVIILGVFFALKNIDAVSVVSNIFFLVSCGIYAVFIIIAIIKAYGTFRSRFFPSLNSLFIIIGYTSFLFCEIFTVYGELVKEKVFLAKLMTTPYYTAGFLFLALSGYAWEKVRDK